MTNERILAKGVSENILTLPRDKLILVTNGELAREYDKILPYSTPGKQ